MSSTVKPVESRPVKSEPVDSGGVPVARLVQITDCHLGPDDSYVLAGIHTRKSLDSILQVLDVEQADAGERPFHLMVTGDIAAHGSPGAYDGFLKLMEANSDKPYRWLPGNHDDFSLMQSIAPGMFESVFEFAGWRLMSLNSAVPNRVAGNLSAEELENLAKALDQHSQNPVMLFMHHPPMNVGCRWLDRQQIANGEALAKVVADHKNVKAIFTGHVHQACETLFGGVPLLTTPSTCFQFAPGQDDFGLDSLPPGYRRIDLYSDGSFVSEVIYLDGYPESVDVGIQGY